MNRVLISVEGQTEETFVREVLRPFLSGHNVHPIPVILIRKIVKSGPNFKGGISAYQKTRREILRLLNDTDAVGVTSMYDLYGLPNDFPGVGIQGDRNCYERVQRIEEAITQDLDNIRFKPYLQLHEFEALLFANPDIFHYLFGDPELVEYIRQIRGIFNTPEEINDNPVTSPSHRIVDIFPAYQKTLHGPIGTIEIGIDALSQECPHFHEWVDWLIALGK